MDARSLLLATSFRHVINEPNIEAGFERFAALTNAAIGYEEFCETVAACLRDGLIREPIRLPEGALHCHWHLELTPKGIAALRSVPERGADNRTTCSASDPGTGMPRWP